MNSILDEYNNLKNTINQHRKNYYELDSPTITDAEYDRLYARLQQLETQYPQLHSSDSPTELVGGEPNARFPKVRHRVRMLSLANAFEPDDLRKYAASNWKILKDEKERLISEGNPSNLQLQFVAELKFDGLAVSLRYEDGVFVQGSTRGNGTLGEDVTENIRTITSIPKDLNSAIDRANRAGIQFPKSFEVRGEVVMRRDVFDRLNSELQESGEKKLFSNPRNAAAGSLRQLNPQITATRKLNFYAYEAIFPEPIFDSHYEAMCFLKGLGFPVDSNITLFDTKKLEQLENSEVSASDPNERASMLGIEAVIDYLQLWSSKRTELPFDIDGIVIKENHFKIRNLLGTTAKTPKWAIAYKLTSTEVETQVLEINVGVGRTGVLTPVAKMIPVEVDGSIVSSATLHNYNQIKNKDIKIGDWVWLHKAGQVIPEVIAPIVEKRTGEEQEFIMPQFCPVCGSEVEQQEVEFRCVNPECAGRLKASLLYFVSKVKILGIGKELVSQLVDSGLARTPVEIYSLSLEKLKSIGQGPVQSQNIIDAIEGSKPVDFIKFLTGLGIEGIADATTLHIARKYKNIQNLLAASSEDLAAIPGMGSGMIKNFIDGLESNRKMLQQFLEMGLCADFDDTNYKKHIADKLFLITGNLQNYSREEAWSRILALGGVVSKSISSKLDYIVVGKAPGKKKIEAIEKLNSNGEVVKVISEEEFIKLLESDEE